MYLDDHEYRETDTVRQQGRYSRQEQAAEGVASGHVAVGAAADILQHTVQLLGTVADPDSEHQERYQDRKRIQFKAQGRQQPELPYHRHQRAADHHQGGAQAMRVPVQQRGGYHHGDGEKTHYHEQAVQQVPHQLGEADDIDRPVRVVPCELRPDILQLAAQFTVIQSRPGLRVTIEQRHNDGGRLRIVAYQVAHDPGPGNIGFDSGDGLRRTVVVSRYYRPALKTEFRYRLPAGVGRPDRFHTVAIHAGHEKDGVVDLLYVLKVLPGKNIAILDGDHHPQIVTKALEVNLVGLVVEYIGMVLGQRFLKARLQGNFGRLVAQYQGDQQAQSHHHWAMVENQLFKKRAGLKVEFPQIRYNRQVCLWCVCHGVLSECPTLARQCDFFDAFQTAQ